MLPKLHVIYIEIYIIQEYSRGHHHYSWLIPFTSNIIGPKNIISFTDSSRKLAMFSDVWGLFTLLTVCELSKNKTWNSLWTFRKYDLSLTDLIKFLESQKDKENLFEGSIPHQRFFSGLFFQAAKTMKWSPKWILSPKSTFPHTTHSWLSSKSYIRVSGPQNPSLQTPQNPHSPLCKNVDS